MCTCCSRDSLARTPSTGDWGASADKNCASCLPSTDLRCMSRTSMLQNKAGIEGGGCSLGLFNHLVLVQSRFPAQVGELTRYLLGGCVNGEGGHFGANEISAGIRAFHANENKKS